MLQKYDVAPPRLATRLVKAAAELAVTVPTGYVQLANNLTAQVRDGAPRGELVVGVASDSLRIGAGVLDTAQRHDLPGSAQAGQFVQRARERLAPFAELVVPPAGAALPGPVDDLRTRGRALLERSCGLGDSGTHPAYRHVLDSLAPDEARILRFLAEHGSTAILDVVEHDRAQRTTRVLVHHLSFLGAEAGCLYPGQISVYLDNLTRLGLTWIRDYPVENEAVYELLSAQPEVEDLPRARGAFTRRKLQPKGIELTAFGEGLFAACFA